MWQWLMTDVTTVAKDVLELSQNRPEKQVYMSLPRPGVRINNNISTNNALRINRLRKKFAALDCCSVGYDEWEINNMVRFRNTARRASRLSQCGWTARSRRRSPRRVSRWNWSLRRWMPRRKSGRRAEALWRRTTTLWSGRRTCRRWHSRCTNSRGAKAPWKPLRTCSPKLSISPRRQTDCTRLWDNSVTRYVAAG